MASVVIGIPCYQNAPSETLSDYMRFAYYLGRRCQEHEFFLGIKAKTEQFRARNSIVTNFLAIGADYLLMMDDDHVIDWEDVPGPHSRYGFVKTLIAHMEANPQLGIVGALYYQRGADCKPVVMREGNDGGFYWLRDDEILGKLQEVAVAGGGCILLRREIFDKIPSPWFEAELDMGTDLQICHKARAAGYKVAVDTSIVLGHVKTDRLVITPANRCELAIQYHQKGAAETPEGMDQRWASDSAHQLYIMDVEERIGRPLSSCEADIEAYGPLARVGMANHADDPTVWYAQTGENQLIRQAWFHSLPAMREQARLFQSMINTHTDGYGLDVGCGSAPVTFDILMRSNHRMDFIDIDGAGGYEFLKWRAKKRGVADRCGWTWGGPYDYVFLLDALEHWKDWQGMLDKIIDRLKDGGAIITNYFRNRDFNNPEHISMDHAAVKRHLTFRGVYPVNDLLWVRKEIGEEQAA